MEGSSISQGTTDVCRPATVARAAERAALEAFSAAFTRELHNVGRNPRILWQQLYNRLQFEDRPVIDAVAAEARRRGRPEAAPWLRLLTRLREAQEALLTVSGHTLSGRACACLPDGRTLV